MITFLDRKKAVSNVKKEDVYNSGFMLPLGTITKCQKKKKKERNSVVRFYRYLRQSGLSLNQPTVYCTSVN